MWKATFLFDDGEELVSYGYAHLSAVFLQIRRAILNRLIRERRIVKLTIERE